MSSPQENSPRNSAAPTRQSAPAPLRGRQTSFISSLRTLPTQRTAAPLSSENSNGLTPLAPQGSQVFEAPPSLRATTSMSSPTSETTRASRGMVDDSFRRSTSRDQGDFVAPDPSLPPSLTRRDKSATFTGDPSDATLGGCDSDVMVAGGGVLSAEEVPGTEPLNRAEDEGAEGLPTDLTSSWEVFLTVGVRLPSDIADKYSQIFFDNELPPPNRRDVLLHGIDHEILTSIGVRIAGHRARIIAACRSLGCTICSRHGCVGCSKESCRREVAPEIASTSHRNISSGRHQQLSQQQQHSRKHHHVQDPHRVHFDAKGEDKGHSGSYNDERESRRMFPVIYRAHSNEVVGDDVDEDDQEVHPSVLRLDQQQQHSNTFMGQEVQSEEGGSFSSDQRAGQGDHSHGDVHGGGGFRPHHHHHHGEDLKEPLIPAASPASGEYSFHGSAPRHAGGNGGHPIVDDYQVHEFVFQSSGPHGYTWIDLVGRDHKRTVFQDHLQRIVNTHGFAEPLLLDIDLTLALPQLISCPNEPDQYLIIVRVAAESSGGIEEDSLHLLTHRVMIAVHLGTRTIVTIHRKDSSLMATLRDTWDASMSDKSMSALLCRLLDDGLLSYVDAIHDSESLLDEYEALMLKHSVGGGSNKSAAAAQSSASRQSLVHLASNASFNGSFDQSAANSAHKSKWSFSKLWGLLCCSDNYPPQQQGRLRSGTNFNNTNSNSNMNNAGGVSGMMRLRNKEYQEEMSESNSFSRQRMNQLLYHLHRRCSVYNRMLTLTQTTLEVSYSSLHLASPEYAEQVGRSCGELAMKAETLHDNCQNLLNLHLSLVSFRTNELMNLLTVYSAIFIPITFVCSVYGMNFVNMPELQIYYGYYYCWAFMLFIVLCIVLWFRRKGFL